MIADERAEPFAQLAGSGRHGIKRSEVGVRLKMRGDLGGRGMGLRQPGDEAAGHLQEPLGSFAPTAR